MKIEIKKRWPYRTARVNNGIKIPIDFMPLIAEQLNNHDVIIVKLKDLYNNISRISVQKSDGYLYIGKTTDVIEKKW